MNARPFLPYPRPHVGTSVSAPIATGLLNALASLFLRDGTPFEQIVIAEHACAN
jgi:hypothetical protein